MPTAAGRTIEPIRGALPAHHPPHRGAMDMLSALAARAALQIQRYRRSSGQCRCGGSKQKRGTHYGYRVLNWWSKGGSNS